MITVAGMLGRRKARGTRVWLGAVCAASVLAGAPIVPALAQTSTTPTTSGAAPTTTTTTSTSITPTTAATTTTTTTAPTTAPTTGPTTGPATVPATVPTTVPTTGTTPGPTAPGPPPAAAPTTAGPTTSSSSSTSVPGPPPASLSNDEVSSILGSLAKTASSSTDALLAALRPLQDYGFTPQEAMMMGMGRFPVAGEAYFSDDFGDARLTPEPHVHKGNDIFAAFDTPVRSPADGVLQYSVEPLAGGNAAYVTTPDGTWYYMAHLDSFAPGLSSGMSVHQGQLVGFTGDTGNAKGGPPHVHFEIHPGGGAAVDPKPILDQWLADAIAGVPALLAPYQEDGTRSLTAIGLARHFDEGMLSGPSDLLASADDGTPDAVGARQLADALLAPITPQVLRDASARG